MLDIILRSSSILLHHPALCLAGIGFFLAWWFYATDITRIIWFTAYRYGYNCGQGKGVIPGPLEDTRITRFTDGPKKIQEYRHTYGPLYRVFCGSIPEIVLTDPEDIRAYYHGDAKVHGKNPGMGFGYLMKRLLGHAVGLQDNERWRRLRSLLDPHFSAAHAFALLPNMVSDTESWLATVPSLQSTVKDDSKNSLNVDIDRFVATLPFRMIARRLFGDMLDEEVVQELLALNETHERVISATFLSKFQQWKVCQYLPLQINRDVDRFEAQWGGFLTRICTQTEERGYSSSMLDLYKNVKEGGMTFLEFAHTIDEILFTNIDVTTTAVAWAVAQIGMVPDVQLKLYAEITQALNDPSLGSTREERSEAYIRKTDTFLHHCNMESGRLRPVLHYSLPEVMSHAKVIHGYYIPPNSSVLIDAYTLNRTSPVWGNDGNAFRPERFAELNPTRYRYSFWRFGLGPRKCVGINFADKIVKMILMLVIEKYHVRVMDDWLTEEKTKFVNAPAGMMIWTPRDGAKI